MTGSDLSSALSSYCSHTYHLAAPEGLTEYIVWAEYGLKPIRGDDRTQLIIPRVQIDAYCQEDATLDALPTAGFLAGLLAALDGIELAYEVQECGYDPDAAATRLILQCDVA